MPYGQIYIDFADLKYRFIANGSNVKILFCLKIIILESSWIIMLNCWSKEYKLHDMTYKMFIVYLKSYK